MAAFRCVFWNLNRQPLTALVAALVAENNVDVLVLAESVVTASDLIARVPGLVENESLPGSRLQFFARRSLALTRVFDDVSGHSTIRAVAMPDAPPILVAATHFQSKLHWDEVGQALDVVGLASSIATAEDDAGHQRTVLLGDFNMSPFEPGMTGATALHAVMSADVAAQATRVVSGKTYRLFYNPMWSLYGDRTPGPPGTYFHTGSTQVEHFWHMYDQIVVRPDLVPRLARVTILDKIGQRSLLSATNRPDRSVASDHLPVLAQFDF